MTRPAERNGDAAGALAGGGEMGVRVRTKDWSTTSLGPVDTWPQSLRSAMSICLGSRFPIAIYWGAELALLYNDAWSPIPGSKHPWALGRGAREVWPEIWDTIGPLFDQVMSTGEATYSEDTLLPMHRHGYTEECYFNFTFTPIRGEAGRVEGVFNAVIETTFRVISERRTRLLGNLGERTGDARTAEEACVLVAETLATAAEDVPFCALYLVDPTESHALLAASAGVPRESSIAPERVALHGDSAFPWPFERVRASARLETVTELATRFTGEAPRSPWPEPVHSALVAPLVVAGRVTGFLVLGASPRRAIDEEYRQFAERLASHTAGVIARATSYEEQRQRAEALAEIDRAKTAFFTNISHEFRTPLTLMLGPLEDALASPDAALRGDDLTSAYRNAVRLTRLVNTLLDVSRLEAGRIDATFEPTDIAALTRDLAAAFEPAMTRGGLELVVRCESLDEPVWVDPRMWEKIVLNLLSNAFKHTFAGRVEVVVSRTGDAVQLEVKDTGIGIAAEHLPRLFDRFHRIEGVRARTHEGSGIGLALVRDLVHLHGGTIEVESEVGRGTSFVVRLPLGSAHLPADRTTSKRSDGPRASTLPAAVAHEASRWLASEGDSTPAAPLERATDATDTAAVLVADDNADMREYIARVLRPHVRVTTVADGDAALRAVANGAFDLVLTDVMMPGIDGFELLRRLRAQPGGHMPIVLLSARAGEEARVEGLVAGADDYLVKPFSARELVARVETHVRLSRLHRRTEALLEREQAALAETTAANRAKDEFLAMLGHELRNPLAPIVTACQLLRMGGAMSREHEIIERQVGHLTRLVDDLLDVARIARGKIELRREAVEISAVVARAVEMTAPLLEQRRHRLDLRVPTAGLQVHADPSRLAQVLGNLLTNAAKYTSEGGRIEVSAAAVDGTLQLRVRDEGVGIDPALLEHVFDMFFQHRQGLDRASGGLGLGLTIARSLVELHGGRVTATSAGSGSGSEFLVELPLASPTVAPQTRIGVAGFARTASPKRVLVVDDNLDLASLLAAALTSIGHDVALAHDGPTALDLAARFQPHVAVLDLGLPVMDGYELARRLTEASSAAPRLIALTGYGLAEDRARSKAAGFTSHLVKPVDLEALFAAIVA